jgi:hypothetical protein
MRAMSDPSYSPTDQDLLDMLGDPSNPFAPRRGEFDASVRIKELDDDGIAGEVIFPQMAPFGAGLMQYRHDVKPEHGRRGVDQCRRHRRDGEGDP